MVLTGISVPSRSYAQKCDSASAASTIAFSFKSLSSWLSGGPDGAKDADVSEAPDNNFQETLFCDERSTDSLGLARLPTGVCFFTGDAYAVAFVLLFGLMPASSISLSKREN